MFYSSVRNNDAVTAAKLFQASAAACCHTIKPLLLTCLCGWLQQAIILGVLSFFMAWVVQAFFASVLLDIVNAVFICYAMDKDTHSVTNPEVHEVFSQVSAAA